MMDILRWLSRLIFEPTAEEYFARFVVPQVERAKRLGIPIEELDVMWDMALQESDVYRPPGIALRRLIDRWESEHAS